MTDRAVARFRHDQITWVLMGLGYVGLPGAATMAEIGLDAFDHDLALVLTLHSMVDCDAVSSAATVVLDTRNVYWRRGEVPSNVHVL